MLSPSIGHSCFIAFLSSDSCVTKDQQERTDWEIGVKLQVQKEDKICLVERMKILDSLASTLKQISTHSFLSPPPPSLVSSHLILDVPRNRYSLSKDNVKSFLYNIFLFTFCKKQYIRPNQNRIILNRMFFNDYEWNIHLSILLIPLGK